MGWITQPLVRFDRQLGLGNWQLHSYGLLHVILILIPISELKCTAVNDSSAQALWPEKMAGETSVLGQCYPNTSGQPRRDCFYNATWSEVLNPCSSTQCS